MRWALRWPAKLTYLAIIILLCGNWTHGLSCGATENINTNFGASGSGLVDDTAAFTGTGSFLDFAINTYQPANPGKTICLSLNGGNRYFFGLGAVPLAIFDGVTNLVVNGNGATLGSALNLTAVSGAAGQKVLTFTSVPSGVLVGMPVIDDTNTTAIDGNTQTVASKTATTVTLNVNIAAPGVSAGDIISFKGGGGTFGTNGQIQDAAHTQTVATVAAGATSVTLTDPTQTSKFTVNTWNFMAGVGPQGFGQPLNAYYHEFVFITAIDSTPASPTYGKITFQSPLKFGYKSTWPDDQDLGGPGALWAMPASWNVNHTYNSNTFIGWDGLGNTGLNVDGRVITFNGCYFPGAFGINISQNQTITLNNCNMPNLFRMEVDKLYETAIINGGTIGGLDFQSATANDTLTLNGVHLPNDISGSPGVLNINNSTIDGGMKPGATAYGVTTAINCTASNLGTGGVYGWAGANDTNITAANGVTINTSGLMTIPHALMWPVRWAVPGADMYIGNPGEPLAVPFSVIDITGDANNTLVQTTLTGSSTLIGSVVTAAPAKTINFVGCTGSPNVLDWSQAGAQNARPGTYSNRIYTCTNGIAAQKAAHPGVPVIDLNSPPADPKITRAMTSITIAVSQAESGSAVNWQIGGQFNNGGIYSSSNVFSLWNPIINLNAAGTRNYNGTTNTWSGLQTGDTLPTTTPGFPSYVGGSNAFTPWTSRSVTGETAGSCPIVTMTIQTSYLLQRDLDPAANDNAPMFESMAA